MFENYWKQSDEDVETRFPDSMILMFKKGQNFYKRWSK